MAKKADDHGVPERFLDQLAANERLAELGKISAGVIHELNTPLSVIVAASQMVLREEGLSPLVTEMVERIGVEAQRLSLLTRGVLSFSRAGEQSSEATVNETLKELLTLLRFEAGKRSVTVNEELDFSIPPVLADGNSLKQVFLNIIMNALQAMPDGGTLSVTTAAGIGTVIVRITDTGPGIPSEVEEKIFEPFFTTKKAGEGTGLGLYVTRTLVDQMNGTIKLRSIAGVGTEFTLTLKAVPER